MNTPIAVALRDVTKALRFSLVIAPLVMSAGCGGGGSGSDDSVRWEVPVDFVVADRIDFDDALNCGNRVNFLSSVGQRCTQINTSTRLSLDGDPVSAGALTSIHRAFATLRATAQELHGRLGSYGWTSASASKIDVERVLVGPVTSVDAARGRFVAMGQQIQVLESTILIGFDEFAALAPGDLVTVTGLYDVAGNVAAAAVLRETAASAYVVRGVLAQNAGTWRVGALRVDLSRATFEGFPGGAALSDDPVVLFADAPPANDGLAVVLARYTGEAWTPSDAADSRVLSGIVTLNSGIELRLGARVVQCGVADCESAFAGARPPLGTFVRIAGTRVEFASTEVLPSLWVAGPVDNVDPANGVLSVLGFPLQTTPGTWINTLGGPPLALDEIEAGDVVAAAGCRTGDYLGFSQLSRENRDNAYRIAANTWERDGDDFRVLGRIVHIDDSADIYDECGYTLTRDHLFALTPSSQRLSFVVADGSDLIANRVTVGAECNEG